MDRNVKGKKSPKKDSAALLKNIPRKTRGAQQGQEQVSTGRKIGIGDIKLEVDNQRPRAGKKNNRGAAGAPKPKRKEDINKGTGKFFADPAKRTF